MSKIVNALFEKRGRERERRAIKKVLRARRDFWAAERDKETGYGFDWRERVRQGLDEALRAITRHARKC